MLILNTCRRDVPVCLEPCGGAVTVRGAADGAGYEGRVRGRIRGHLRG